MPILISIPDNCKALGDAVTVLVTSVERAHRRADGGRALDYAQIERDIESGRRPSSEPLTRVSSPPSMWMPRQW
jgi:hypothetical protein